MDKEGAHYFSCERVFLVLTSFDDFTNEHIVHYITYCIVSLSLSLCVDWLYFLHLPDRIKRKIILSFASFIDGYLHTESLQ